MTPPDGDTTRDWHDRQAHVPYEARAGLTWYKKLGYIAADKTAESASSTLEDTYDDYAVAQVARALGRQDDYRFFIERSRNYRNLYNPADGLHAGPECGRLLGRPGRGLDRRRQMGLHLLGAA